MFGNVRVMFGTVWVMFGSVFFNLKNLFSAYGLKLLIIHSIFLGVQRVLNQHLLVQELLHHQQHLLHLLIHLMEILSGKYVNIE